MIFFAHLYGMDDKILTKMDDKIFAKIIFKYVFLGKKSTTSRIQEVKEDSEEKNIKSEEANLQQVFMKKVLKIEGF